MGSVSLKNLNPVGGFSDDDSQPSTGINSGALQAWFRNQVPTSRSHWLPGQGREIIPGTGAELESRVDSFCLPLDILPKCLG